MKKTNILTIIIHKTVSRLSYRDNNIWVFGEWFGKRCCDNSMYFANYMAQNHPDIKCVWIARKGTDLSNLDKKINVYEIGERETNIIVKNAHIIIMNQGFLDVLENTLVPGGPISVNFWHGVPWKKIGLDGFEQSNKLKRFYYSLQTKVLSSDYYLSLSDDFSSILRSACGAKRNKIIQAGYPRNSLFYNPSQITECKDKLIKYINKKQRGIETSQATKIITYMPTFRDKTDKNFSFFDMGSDELSRLKTILEGNDAIIIQKAHYASKVNTTDSYYSRIINADEYPAQELLATSDILITDYSSCFFDYLLLDRPIIHYLYDYEYYSKLDRGLYYTKEEVAAGDVATSEEELIQSISLYIENEKKDHDLRKKRKEKYIQFESEDSCSVIFEYLKRLKR